MPANKSVSRELPTLADVAPRWADLTRALLTLSRQHENLLAEAEALPAPRISAGIPRPKSPPPQPKPLSPAAKAVLGSLEIPPVPPVEFQTPDPAIESTLSYGDPMAQQAADMQVRIEGVREAIAAIHTELPRAFAEGSRAYCDLVREQYSERASRVCKALIELAAAYTEHQDFLTRVQHAGASPAFLAPLNLQSTSIPYVMGNVRAGESAVFEVISRAAEGGHIGDQADAVAALRRPAPPLPPAPFAEAAADAQAAAKAREDARAGRAKVFRWNGRGTRMITRAEAAKLDAARVVVRVPADDVATILEPTTRESRMARVKAALRGSPSGTGAESNDDEAA